MRLCFTNETVSSEINKIIFLCLLRNNTTSAYDIYLGMMCDQGVFPGMLDEEVIF